MDELTIGNFIPISLVLIVVIIIGSLIWSFAKKRNK